MELRKEFGYDGKPKQWQLGFDALARHFDELLKQTLSKQVTEENYKTKYDKCIEVIKRFDAGIITMYDL